MKNINFIILWIGFILLLIGLLLLTGILKNLPFPSIFEGLTKSENNLFFGGVMSFVGAILIGISRIYYIFYDKFNKNRKKK